MEELIRKIKVIYKDKDLLVIEKPAGVSVHPPVGDRKDDFYLTDWLVQEFPETAVVGDEPSLRPGLVHRLDKDTSGVMVIARNQDSFEALKNIFKNRLAEKTYWAIVCGTPKEKTGVISMPIGRLVKNPLKRGVAIGQIRIRGEREAFTEYKVLRGGEKYSLLELRPKTGRMHQLRVHLKAIGYPVACDKIYGGTKVCCPPDASRQLLHAKSLSFSFPAGRKLYFEADPPEDFAKSMNLC
ncbi:MAG: RluA family pseudouridine synthase [bacterium]|nr:RluA family pseudouridine synthase [bacterium]